jgi:hypothetical protein
MESNSTAQLDENKASLKTKKTKKKNQKKNEIKQQKHDRKKRSTPSLKLDTPPQLRKQQTASDGQNSLDSNYQVLPRDPHLRSRVKGTKASNIAGGGPHRVLQGPLILPGQDDLSSQDSVLGLTAILRAIAHKRVHIELAGWVKAVVF